MATAEVALNTIEQAQVEATVTEINTSAAVCEAQGEAAVAQAHAETAIAEATAEHANTIVAVEAGEEEAYKWLEERLDNLLRFQESLTSTLQTQAQSLNQLENLNQQLLKIVTMLEAQALILAALNQPSQPQNQQNNSAANQENQNQTETITGASAANEAPPVVSEKRRRIRLI